MHATMQSRIRTVEINIEPARIGARRALPQNILPIAIEAAGDRHMIGDDIENNADPRRAQRMRQRQELFLSAQFRIDRRVVDRVVAVHRPGSRTQDRRDE